MRFSVKKSSYSSKQFVFQVRSSYFKLVVGESVVGKLVVGKSVVGESVVGESVVGESVVGESVVRKSFDVCPLILIPMTEYHDVCPLILIPMTEYCISYDSAIKKIKRSTEKTITTIIVSLRESFSFDLSIGVLLLLLLLPVLLISRHRSRRCLRIFSKVKCTFQRSSILYFLKQAPLADIRCPQEAAPSPSLYRFDLRLSTTVSQIARLRRQKQGGWESRACFLFSIFYDSKSMLNWRTLLLLLRAAVPATEEFSHGTESWRLLSRTCNSGVE